MVPLKVRQFPDPVLRQVSAPIKKIDRALRSLVDRLIDTMRFQPGGIGIAAPQIGILKQVAIVDVSRKEPGAKMLVLINPKIIALEEERIFREGCMSLPDYTANVKRANHIRIRYYDMELRTQEFTASGLEARCIQHEVDHLNGILFVDRVASVKSDVFPRKRYL